MGEQDLNTKRQYYRLDELDMPAKFRIIQEDEAAGAEEGQFAGTSIRDLSAGGLSFMSIETVERGADVQVMITLENTDLHLFGKVMRATEASKGFEVGIKFESIDQLEQDKIMGYIFQKQLELRRRGLR